MIKLIINRGFVIEDRILFKIFGNITIAAKTEITDILLEYIQKVNYTPYSSSF